MQTVETLIGRRILRRLIWVCTVCQLPFYGSPDYNGLNEGGITLLSDKVATILLRRTEHFDRALNHQTSINGDDINSRAINEVKFTAL